MVILAQTGSCSGLKRLRRRGHSLKSYLSDRLGEAWIEFGAAGYRRVTYPLHHSGSLLKSLLHNQFVSITS